MANACAQKTELLVQKGNSARTFPALQLRPSFSRSCIFQPQQKYDNNYSPVMVRCSRISATPLKKVR